ncbi:MAG: tetratricopeptide repeat protein [Planctomycetota bacterium]
MIRRRFAFSLALVPLLGALTFAGDAEATAEYRKAMGFWKTDAKQCQEHLEKALAQTDPKAIGDSKVLRSNITLILGQFHQAKTGDFDQAEKYYKAVLEENHGAKDPKTKNLKAQALLNLGTIWYSEKKNINEAVTKYKDAHQTYPTALTADVLSQILYRQARDPKTQAREKKLKTALKAAREAILIDKKDANHASTPATRSKYRLQLVLVLTAMGLKDEAESEWKQVEQDKLGDTALYQLAQLAALRGEGIEAVGKLLRQAIDPKLRPDARARNQLRWFIRTEGDFAKFTEDASWKDLVTDEQEKGTK